MCAILEVQGDDKGVKCRDEDKNCYASYSILLTANTRYRTFPLYHVLRVVHVEAGS